VRAWMLSVLLPAARSRFVRAVPSLAMPMNGFALHWVFRVSRLQPTLEFLSKVFGMRVLRHEENSDA